MKKFYNTVIIVLMFSIILSFGACGGNFNPPQSTSSKPTTSSSKISSSSKEDNSQLLNKVYKRVNANNELSISGEYLLLGSYPQSQVNDTTLTSTLLSIAGNLPTSSNNNSWIDYKYYLNSDNSVAFMWYKDVFYSNQVYRGVYFNQYRPYEQKDSVINTFNQKDNGYDINSVYWFKFEPIKWKILYEKNDKAIILSDVILDSQPYQNALKMETVGGVQDFYAIFNNGQIMTDSLSNKVYANNYEYSNVRKWLINVFYNTSFNDLEKAVIRKDVVKNGTDVDAFYGDENKYVCNDTNDSVYLLSHADITNTLYGFSSYSTDTARIKTSTDYALSQGLYSNTNSKGPSSWCTRTPLELGSLSREVKENGEMDSFTVNYLSGVVPALTINL